MIAGDGTVATSAIAAAADRSRRLQNGRLITNGVHASSNGRAMTGRLARATVAPMCGVCHHRHVQGQACPVCGQWWAVHATSPHRLSTPRFGSHGIMICVWLRRGFACDRCSRTPTHPRPTIPLRAPLCLLDHSPVIPSKRHRSRRPAPCGGRAESPAARTGGSATVGAGAGRGAGVAAPSHRRREPSLARGGVAGGACGACGGTSPHVVSCCTRLQVAVVHDGPRHVSTARAAS